MSMPQELFYPVGIVTCIMVWIAGKPHAESNRKTWFGYWRDDCCIKTKHKGRIDQNDAWPTIRDRWVEMYRNREVHKGESAIHMVTADDEWCAEAYIETDYSSLTRKDLESDLKSCVLFNLMLDVQSGASQESDGNRQEESDDDA